MDKTIAVVGTQNSYRRWRKDNPDLREQAFLANTLGQVQSRRVTRTVWLSDAAHLDGLLEELEAARQR